MKMKTLPFVAVIGALVILFADAPADTYVVRPDGTGDFPTIVAAVAQAGDTDVIELTDGTFTGDGNRDIGFGGKAITIRSQSGDPEACIIDCEGTQLEQHRGFLFESGEGSDSRVEGVTVTGADSWGGSGAFCSQQSSPTFVNCVFRDNRGDGGGGLLCWDGAAPELIDCIFSGNEAANGAGMSLSRTTATLTRCVFMFNVATNAGGGLDCGDGSSPTLTECLFLGNTSVFGGGGLRCSGQSSPSVADCTFSGNSSGSWGAGLYCQNGSSPVLSYCTFVANTGPSGITSVGDAAPEIQNSIIVGGVDGPAVTCFTGGTVTLTCTDIFGNEGGDWVGDIAGQLGVGGNVSVDPEFCSLTPGIDVNFTLQSDSPCAAENNPGCGRIGAWPAGCGASAVEPSTWGQIKASIH